MEGKYCHYYYLPPAPFKAVPVVKAVHVLMEGSGAFFLLSLLHDTEKDRYQELEAKGDL